MTEPWISGSYGETAALLRPLLHALDHAEMDLAQWTEGMGVEQLWAEPGGLGSIGFHVRHIAGSTDRLFTYVEGRMLTEGQMEKLRAEKAPGAGREELLGDVKAVFDGVRERVKGMDVSQLSEARGVGRKQLPTTVIGLLVHIAEHTMRHVGAVIVTAKVVRQGM